jgi:hypothetical protein
MQALHLLKRTINTLARAGLQGFATKHGAYHVGTGVSVNGDL